MEETICQLKTWVPTVRQNEPKKVKGHLIFKEPYTNVAIIAKKRSGKSVVLGNILRAKAIPNFTKIIVFCPSFELDRTWLGIRDYLEKKGIDFDFEHSFLKDGFNLVQAITETLQKPEYNEPAKAQKFEPSMFIKALNLNDEDTKPMKRKPKKLAPKYIFVFDDCGGSRRDGLRNPAITQLLKVHRHLKSMCILSSQFETDLEPGAWQQIDHCLLFKSIPDKRLDNIKTKLDLPLELDEFVKIYQFATKQKYNHLTIDVRSNQFRRNFTHLLNTEKIIDVE